jgi:hypothetical protein
MANKKEVVAPKAEQRARLSQSDIPAYTIERALAIARAIGDTRLVS